MHVETERHRKAWRQKGTNSRGDRRVQELAFHKSKKGSQANYACEPILYNKKTATQFGVTVSLLALILCQSADISDNQH